MVCLKKCLTGETVLELDVTRPTRAVEELHQVAATRTERRLLAHVDFRREMRPIAFVDPEAFVGTNPGGITSGLRVTREEPQFSDYRWQMSPQEDLNEAVVRRTLARAWSMRQHR